MGEADMFGFFPRQRVVKPLVQAVEGAACQADSAISNLTKSLDELAEALHKTATEDIHFGKRQLPGVAKSRRDLTG